MAQRPTTTFHMDFAIAEHFGLGAVEDTFNRAFNEWRTNYLMLTEFVLVLNQRCWMWYDKGVNNNNDSRCMELSRMYSEYYYTAHDWACENLTEKEFDHYFSVID